MHPDICELDIIYKAVRVHVVVDEIVQGGLMLETKRETIVDLAKRQYAFMDYAGTIEEAIREKSM